MKPICLIFIVLFFSCTGKKETATPGIQTDTIAKKEIPVPPKTYSNARFKNVTAIKTGANQFEISGEGQVFEAAFSWVIEDGHNELATGHEMTDAGAPEWGKFKFTVTAQKVNPDTVLHLVIYEVSAMDGSRQHELMVPLE